MSAENSKGRASEQRGGLGAGTDVWCLVNFARLLLVLLVPSSVSHAILRIL